jgi:cytidine deaminase
VPTKARARGDGASEKTRTRKDASPSPPGNLAELRKLARAARRHARAPHSGYRVGAALRTDTGLIVTGCNVENATYGLTLCAERVAVFKAVSEGLRRFDAVAVVVDSPRLAAPCGSCRQVLWELCGDIWVHMANQRGRTLTVRLSELLPLPFDERDIE